MPAIVDVQKRLLQEAYRRAPETLKGCDATCLVKEAGGRAAALPAEPGPKHAALYHSGRGSGGVFIFGNSELPWLAFLRVGDIRVYFSIFCVSVRA